MLTQFEKYIFIVAILSVIFFFFFLGLEENESVPIPVIPPPRVPSTGEKEESVQISISVTTNQVGVRKIKMIRFRISGPAEVGSNKAGADLGEGCRGCAPLPPPPPEMTCGFLIQLEFSKKTNYVVYWC